MREMYEMIIARLYFYTDNEKKVINLIKCV